MSSEHHADCSSDKKSREVSFLSFIFTFRIPAVKSLQGKRVDWFNLGLATRLKVHQERRFVFSPPDPQYGVTLSQIPLLQFKGEHQLWFIPEKSQINVKHSTS